MKKKRDKNNLKRAVALLAALFYVFMFDTAFLYAQSATADNAQQNTEAQNNDNENAQTNQTRNGVNMTFSDRGIFGCSANIASPVGLSGPPGAYVPVFDAAVHSHVQILTYKECVLDSIVRRLTNANLATVVSSYIDKVNKSKLCRNGVCRYGLAVGDINEYLENMVEKPITLKFYKEICKKNVKEEFQDICDKVLLDKKKEFDDPYQNLNCPLSDEDLKLYMEGRLFDYKKRAIAIENPGCNKLQAYSMAKQVLSDIIEKEKEKEKWEITIGRGFAPIKAKVKKRVRTSEGIKELEQEVVVTPGSVIADHLSLVLGSGVRRLETADEIDEVVQSFFANLGNAILDEQTQGLYGINKIYTDPETGIAQTMSYLDALVRQESDAASGARYAVGARSLQSMIANHLSYIEAKTKTANAILNAIHSIRANEEACFDQKILVGAQEGIKDEIQNQLCPSSTSQQNSANTNSCSVSFSVEQNILPDFFDVKEKREGNRISHGTLIFYGKAKNGSATLIVSNGKKIKSEQVTLSDNWQKEIDSDSLPENDLSATLTYSSGSSMSQNLYKETIADIPIIVLPAMREKIKIKVDATATISSSSGASVNSSTQSASKTVILQRTRHFSQEYTGKDSGLTNTLRRILRDIKRARETLKDIQEIATLSQADPDLALWRLDKLKIETDEFGKTKIVFDHELRQAKEEAQNAQGVYPSTVESVLRDKWENEGRGWCNKDKWNLFEVNN